MMMMISANNDVTKVSDKTGNGLKAISLIGLLLLLLLLLLIIFDNTV